MSRAAVTEPTKKFLQSRGFSIATRKDATEALIWSTRAGFWDVARIAIQNRADVNAEDTRETTRGRTPLFYAICAAPMDLVLLLLSSGASINEADDHGASLLLAAATCGREDMISFLVSKGARHDLCKPEATALHYSGPSGDATKVRLLLGLGADIKGRDQDENTAMHLAASSNLLKGIQLLLFHKANVNASNNWGRTPLYIAAENGFLELARALLDAGAEHTGDRYGSTPLYAAARSGHDDLIELLWSRGIEINCRRIVDARFNVTGDTALQVAAQGGHKSAVQMLLARGAKINIQSSLGETALHRAVYWNHVRTAELLVHGGANVNVKNKEGTSPWQRAMWMSSGKALVEVLEASLTFNRELAACTEPEPLIIRSINRFVKFRDQFQF